MSLRDQIDDIEKVMRDLFRRPLRTIFILFLLAVLFTLGEFIKGVVEELGHRAAAGPAQVYKHETAAGAKVEINLGKEYAFRDHTGNLSSINLTQDFKNDPGLKAEIDLGTTFCYLAEIRGLTANEGADLVVQNDETSKPAYFLYFYNPVPNSIGVVRVSCVTVR